MKKTQGTPYSKEFPADLDNERVVLATIFHGNDPYWLKMLDKADFVDPLHRTIVDVIQDMVASKAPLNYISLKRVVTDRYETKAIRDYCSIQTAEGQEPMYLAMVLVLDTFCPNTTITYHWRELRGDRCRRKLMILSDEIRYRAKDLAVSPLDTYKWLLSGLPKTIKKTGLEVEL